MRESKWYEMSYRRNLVDMHIEEWDDVFLSKLDPVEYVRLLKTARVQSAMVYANSHVGYCYWPTETGHMHKGLKGRDVFGEIEKLCHKEGMDFIAYYSLIFNNWAYEYNPSWRIRDVDGNDSRTGKDSFTYKGRYGLCCPNSGYRDFAVAQAKELCGKYNLEGIFFDMTFWPEICYCTACKKRFKEETGEDMPEIIDWNNPLWIKFQKKREEWMAEFAMLMTRTVKSIKPDMTVLHNTAPVPVLPWQFGATEGVVDACDYLGADFYLTIMHQSFICKLYYNITNNLPFEFYTSRSDPNLNEDHVSTKHIDQLKLNNFISMAHHGAFLFIDAIDPAGTLNQEVYETMGEVFKESQVYEPYIGGQMLSDIAIYYSLSSKMDPEDSGKSVRDHSIKMPHLDAALGAARILKEAHIPFTVISRKNLKDLSKYQVLILPDVIMLDESEAEAVRKYVDEGGSLYASGHTSPFLLADVFGIEYVGETKERVTFMAPTAAGKTLMRGMSERYPLTINSRQVLVKAIEPENVIARIVLPYTDPADFCKFASIHSNPPGNVTDYPSLIYRNYGKGKVIWSAAAFESIKRVPHARVFENVIRELSKEPFTFTVEAPAPVEVTVFSQNDGKRYIINVINEQEQMPPIKVHGIVIKLRTTGKKVMKVLRLPTGDVLSFKEVNGYVEFELPELDIFEMLAVEFE